MENHIIIACGTTPTTLPARFQLKPLPSQPQAVPTQPDAIPIQPKVVPTQSKAIPARPEAVWVAAKLPETPARKQVCFPEELPHFDSSTNEVWTRRPCPVSTRPSSIGTPHVTPRKSIIRKEFTAKRKKTVRFADEPSAILPTAHLHPTQADQIRDVGRKESLREQKTFKLMTKGRIPGTGFFSTGRSVPEHRNVSGWSSDNLVVVGTACAAVPRRWSSSSDNLVALGSTSQVPLRHVARQSYHAQENSETTERGVQVGGTEHHGKFVAMRPIKEMEEMDEDGLIDLNHALV